MSALCRQSDKRRRRGVAAVAMIAVLVVLSLIIVGMALGSARDLDLTVRRAEALQAQYACEAGVQMAIRELMLGVDEDGDGGVGSISADGDAGNNPVLMGAAFSVVLDQNDGQSILTSQGKSGIARRLTAITLQSAGSSGNGLNLPGVAFTSTIGMWNSSLIDSYDSSIGPYGGSNIGSNAVLASNVSSMNGIAMDSGVTVRGAVYSGVGSNPDTVIAPWSSPTITGGKHALTAALTPPDVTEPTGMPSSSGSFHLNQNKVQVISGDHVYSSFSLSNNSTVQISGPVRIRVTGSFTMSNHTRIELLPGASLELYVDNSFSMNNNTALNAGGDPSKVTIYVLGNNRSLSLNNSAEAYAKILNPKGGIYLNNSAQVFGSVVGSTLHMSNSAAIHVDTQLTGGGLVGGRGGGGGGAGSTKIVAAMEVEP